MSMDEQELQRRRHGDLGDRIDLIANRGGASPGAVVVRTYTKTTYPTTAQTYYACRYVTLGGTETEGGTGTLTEDTTRTLYVWNSGSAIPPTGTYVIAEPVGGRLAMQYG